MEEKEVKKKWKLHFRVSIECSTKTKQTFAFQSVCPRLGARYFTICDTLFGRSCIIIKEREIKVSVTFKCVILSSFSSASRIRWKLFVLSEFIFQLIIYDVCTESTITTVHFVIFPFKCQCSRVFMYPNDCVLIKMFTHSTELSFAPWMFGEFSPIAWS